MFIYTYVCVCGYIIFCRLYIPFFSFRGVRATAQLPRACSSKKKRNNTHALHMPTLSFIYIFCDGHFVLFDDFFVGIYHYGYNDILLYHVIHIGIPERIFEEKNRLRRRPRIVYSRSAVCIQFTSILLCGVVIKTYIIHIQYVYKPHIVYYTYAYVWTAL